MIIRKIQPEEKVAASMIQALSFLGKRDFTEDLADPAAHSKGYENYWGAFSDGGTMTACLILFPYTVLYNGNTAGMGGIGGVASMPEHRMGGAVREMFKNSMASMRDEGQAFSYLYPFSFSFYRQFGYESCYLKKIITCKTQDFKHIKPSGSMSMLQKGDDMAPYMAIHTRFIGAFNMVVKRTQQQMADMMDRDPYATAQYTYLWRNENGDAKSYITFVTENLKDKRHMVVKDFEWMDSEGMRGMLSMISKFSAQAPCFRWPNVPPNFDIALLTHDYFDIECETSMNGMNRVVDAAGAVRLMRVPEGCGGAAVKIVDDFLAWNNVTVKLEWADGALCAERTNAAPDMTVPITSLARLVTGYSTPAALALAGMADIDSNHTALEKLFPNKPVYMNDFF